MPWCDDCAKFWNPNTMRADGSCPSCGRHLADPPVAAAGDGTPDLEAAAGGDDLAATAADDDGGPRRDTDDVVAGSAAAALNLRELAGKDSRTPWHFRLLVVALVGYLGWRGVQMLEWVIHRI